ncbi:23S rRNA (adenine(2030)-N(6))-methyltransferase RlmJ [Ramlibacter pallidus]|uniref:Ribosomal RNA large subunit methyltransferase J n=1 Tax=Ramlibacter pallidus TaxID=2780087 RepID=A0ABR9RYW9_9BURK|nr:23S rRNA (adenine(2030)-N(6))-methyltransferase RlmJ [Ramlibacter pallidus]MBE7366436.1 23S rRNA (adenine(2030)-N(6))-methyltransferase RlmJ [Ramlibacter pallidus]
MFSYRHGFHAGNHADVLKHMVLIAVLKHLTAKPTALTVVDTHAGAGLYRLDDDFAGTSGESLDGIVKLLASPLAADPPGLVGEYLDMVRRFNPSGKTRIYPGSPFVTQALLRKEARDKLWLFELHPTDSKALATHVEQLEAGRQVGMKREDGFEGLRALLPPPSRRGLVLIDPSYEIKNDYARVAACIQESLKKFATGTYMVWYPVIPRPEAHELPRRLKTLSNQAGRPWLHAVLNIGQSPERVAVPGETAPRPGLTASGVFLVNPPHTLKAELQQVLPALLEVLGRGRGQMQVVETGG